MTVIFNIFKNLNMQNCYLDQNTIKILFNCVKSLKLKIKMKIRIKLIIQKNKFKIKEISIKGN